MFSCVELEERMEYLNVTGQTQCKPSETDSLNRETKVGLSVIFERVYTTCARKSIQLLPV